ncbi:MAG: SIMPL domain-containing protein [Propionibacteriales bacterium]|nr:SIMPL domain-containing protein [Propionibacteriales bacterium]
MGILRVSVEDQIRIEAVGATVHVTIAGSSALNAGVTLRKTTEVRELVAALATKGVEEDAIAVSGLRSETSSGLLTKAQKVSICLQITAELDQLPAVLGLLTTHPGVRVDQLQWRYDEFEASIAAATAAMAKARRKADALAAAAGQQITGVAEISDSWSRFTPYGGVGGVRTLGASAKSEAEFDLGFDLTGSTELNVHLSVDYQIGD